VDEVRVAPGETVSVTLCVGIGSASDSALESASTLLSQADDTLPNGMRRKGDGLVTKAWNAHHALRFTSGADVLDQLMTQSLVNVPFDQLRRVGVPSRQDTQGIFGGTYQPAAGGLIALGWIGYRPEWASAQLNAYFLTQGKAEPLPDNPQAVPPTNLFALWELYQRRHERRC